jgi:hypothetical protein
MSRDGVRTVAFGRELPVQGVDRLTPAPVHRGSRHCGEDDKWARDGKRGNCRGGLDIATLSRCSGSVLAQLFNLVSSAGPCDRLLGRRSFPIVGGYATAGFQIDQVSPELSAGSICSTSTPKSRSKNHCSSSVTRKVCLRPGRDTLHRIVRGSDVRPDVVDNGVVKLPPMPWLLLAVCGLLGVVGGAVVGFARGLSYLPTLPFAIIEGAILFGVPATVLGLLLVGCWSIGMSARRRDR